MSSTPNPATSKTSTHQRHSAFRQKSPKITPTTSIAITPMKIFVRHLRTRPKLRPARIPDTNLTSASIPTSAASIPEVTPSPLHPPSESTYTHWRPLSVSRPPAELPHRQRPLNQDFNKPSPQRPNHTPPQPNEETTPKEPRQKQPRLKITDIVPSGITRHAYRWETIAPTPEQLQRADTFFLKYPPAHLWSEAKFKKIDFGDVPEVAFLGRSNVGKSSLLNALLNNKKLAYTSSKPGRTRLMNAFSIADGRMVLLDMPGYGHASREEWGVQIMKYLKSRKQFRRAFLLIDAKHGLKKNDLLLLEQFGREGISFQIVLSKIDRVKPDDVSKLFEDVRGLMETGIAGMNAGLGEILATSGDPARKGEKKVGMSELRWSVMVACGLENVGLGESSRIAKIGLEEQLEGDDDHHKN